MGGHGIGGDSISDLGHVSGGKEEEVSLLKGTFCFSVAVPAGHFTGIGVMVKPELIRL